MKKQVISKAGDWSKWTLELKEALANSGDNTQIGEKIVFENDKFRVWSIHLPVKQSLPFHKHSKPYFWTILNSGRSRSYYNDGSVVDTEYEAGDTKFFKETNEENHFIHNLENIGNTMLIFTTVEFLN